MKSPIFMYCNFLIISIFEKNLHWINQRLTKILKKYLCFKYVSNIFHTFFVLSSWRLIIILWYYQLLCCSFCDVCNWTEIWTFFRNHLFRDEDDLVLLLPFQYRFWVKAWFKVWSKENRRTIIELSNSKKTLLQNLILLDIKIRRHFKFHCR